MNHHRSVIFRRTFPQLRAIIERSREIFNPEGSDSLKDSYNESLHRWMLGSGQMIEFEAVQHAKDREKQRGRPRDLYVFDEATEFSRDVIEFVIAWNRSTNPSQRCRVLLTFNPPTDETGSWVCDFFLPWLAYLHPDEFQHPNPAKPGELRWYATLSGEEIECADGEPFDHEGETIKPRSRSFIPAKLVDNPHLAKTAYGSVLQSLPEPLRSQLLHGDFAASVEANPWQVIPTAWVKLAQARWVETDKPEIGLSGVGIDPARGGKDKAAISKRYGNWFEELMVYPGVAVPDGPTLAELARKALAGETPEYINIDVIGIGASVYDSMKDDYEVVTPVNAAGSSKFTDRSGKLGMRNIRAEYYWRMREGLDPDHGDEIALPPGNEIVADLCAATYRPTVSGIQIEDKNDIKKRIGRSPDVGEAILLANLGGDTGSLLLW